MKANELLKYVSKAAQVVNPSVLVPIAKNLLFDGSYIKATDLNTSIVVEFPDNLVDEPVAVDTQKLVAILKALKNEEISIQFGIPSTKITSSKGEYEIASLDGKDFPPIEIASTDFMANTYLFQRAIELTKNSVSIDELRPVMTGVFFDAEQGYVVSTNGHKLGRYEAKFEDSFILPPSAFGLIASLEDEQVGYGSTGSQIAFHANGVSFSVRKVEGQYPPYQRVIPTTNDKTLTIEQSELLSAVKRISLFASQESSSIILELGQGSKIKGQDVNYGNKAEESLGGKYEGADLAIGLNAKYLVDLLNTTGEGELTITFSEANKPVLISNARNPRYLQLVMPVNI